MGAAALAFITSGPGLIIAALAAVVAGTVAVVSSFRDAQDATKDWTGHTEKLRAALTSLSLTQVDQGIQRLKDSMLENGSVTADAQALYARLAETEGLSASKARELASALDYGTVAAEKFGVATRSEVDALRHALEVHRAHREGMDPARYNLVADAIQSRLNAALGVTTDKAKGATAELEKVLSLADLAAGAGSAMSDFETADTGLQAALDPYAGRDAERAAQAEMIAQAQRDSSNAARARDNELNAILLAEREETEKASAERIAATWTDLASGMSSAWAGLWEDLASGTENAGGRFLGAILRVIGQLAIQWGTYFMLQGAAMMFSPGMQGLGVGLIAGGLALSAMGGAVMGVGAKMAGGSTAGAGGGSQRGPTTSAIESQTGIRRQGEQGGGTVVVNVYSGQVLNTSDDVAVAVHTGMRRAQALGFS